MMGIRILSTLIFLFLLNCNSINGKGDSRSIEPLLMEGEMSINNLEKTYECIISSVYVQGVKNNDSFNSNNIDTIYGNNYYSYHINNTELYIGDIYYDFYFILNKNQLLYKFYNFKHVSNNSDFKYLGVLPAKWNEKMTSTFTNYQYVEILDDININISHTISMIKKYCN